MINMSPRFYLWPEGLLKIHLYAYSCKLSSRMNTGKLVIFKIVPNSGPTLSKNASCYSFIVNLGKRTQTTICFFMIFEFLMKVGRHLYTTM